MAEPLYIRDKETRNHRENGPGKGNANEDKARREPIGRSVTTEALDKNLSR